MSPQELDNAIFSAKAAISALNDCSKRLDHWLLFFTALVVLGVALEIIETRAEHKREYHAWRWGITWLPQKPSRTLFIVKYFAIILVVAGVGGELGINVLSMRLNNKLRIANEGLVNLVDRKAGFAAVRAIDAEGLAEKAGNSAGRAIDLVHQANIQVEDVEIRAGKLVKQEMVLEQSEKKLDEAQQDISRRQNPRWRNLLIGAQNINDLLKGNATSKFDILYAPDDLEAYTTAIVLSGLLVGAGWKAGEIRPIEDRDAVPGISSPKMPLEMNAGASFNVGLGISINVRSFPYPPFGHEKDCAAWALEDALMRGVGMGGPITVDPRLSADVVRIIIGKKP